MKCLKFLKLYLLMEKWFHKSNDKVEFDNAKPLIGEVLQNLQALFPRDDKTNGYCIPKIHEMTKFQTYMLELLMMGTYMCVLTCCPGREGRFQY